VSLSLPRGGLDCAETWFLAAAGGLMPHDPDIHHRRSLRLPGYDYARFGAYFVTVCTQGRECLFGDVTPVGGIALNDAGHMVERWWHELGNKFPHVVTDASVVMPNHFHGIIVIVAVGAAAVGADLRVGPVWHAANAASNADRGAAVGADLRVGPVWHAANAASNADRGAHAGAPLPEIVQWFKTMTTNEYIRGVGAMGWPPFPGKLWQRNYYEHVIRDEAALDRIRRYIEENPLRWALDQENPAAQARTGEKP
jgi:putative transposase